MATLRQHAGLVHGDVVAVVLDLDLAPHPHDLHVADEAGGVGGAVADPDGAGVDGEQEVGAVALDDDGAGGHAKPSSGENGSAGVRAGETGASGGRSESKDSVTARTGCCQAVSRPGREPWYESVLGPATSPTPSRGPISIFRNVLSAATSCAQSRPDTGRPDRRPRRDSVQPR